MTTPTPSAYGCDYGYYCEEGSATQTMCGIGSYTYSNKQSTCFEVAQDGYYFTTSGVYIACDTGYYCEGDNYIRPCPAGFYYSATQATSIDQC
jgi:hypothetical protein